MKDFVIYGASGATEQLLADMRYFHLQLPAALTVDARYIKENEQFGLPVVPFEDIEKTYPPEQYEMIVIGPYDIPRLRRMMYERAKEKNYTLKNYISPGAFVDPDVVMGDNNIIYRGADVGFKGVMGSGNIIRHQVYLGHEFHVGSFNIISPGCTIGGCCTIGDLCWIGLNTTIRDSSTIGNEVLLGMGAVVTKKIEDCATAMGVPAKVVSYHPDGISMLGR